MKDIDFTQPGRIPMTQGRFGFLQTAWQEAAQALAAIGANAGANIATVMYGMASSTTAGTLSLTAGWFVYNGTPIRCPAQSVAAPGAGYAAFIVVTPSSSDTPQPYQDSSTPAVINDVTGVLTVLASGTATDATHFKLSAVAAWVAPDPTVYNYIDNINAEIAALTGAWDSVASPTITVSGGGTFTGGTITYNSAKYLNGNCVVWQLTLSDYTVTGTVNSISIPLPGYVSIGGGGWANPGAIFTGNINFGGALYAVRGVISNGGVPHLIITYEYAAFPTGGLTALNITVMGEVE